MGEEEAGSLTEWKLLIGIDSLSKSYNLKWAEKEVHLINSFTQSPENQGNSSMHYPVEELRKFPHTIPGLRSQGKTEGASEKAKKILCAWKNQMFTVLQQTMARTMSGESRLTTVVSSPAEKGHQRPEELEWIQVRTGGS